MTGGRKKGSRVGRYNTINALNPKIVSDQDLMAALPPRLQKLLQMYQKGHTYKEIGVELGVSAERVRQLLKRIEKTANALANYRQVTDKLSTN